MFGPFPAGRLSGSGSTTASVPFEVGARCRVACAFIDYDGDAHEPGECWTYLGSAFSPYDDGLSLFVSLDGRQEWHIRMSWRPEDQGRVIDALADYVVRDT